MSKTVVINLGKGTLNEGFPSITARLWTEQDPRAEQFVGSIAPAPDLAEIYRIWQFTYLALSNRVVLRLEPAEDELEIEESGVTQVSLQSFDECTQQIEQTMNRWLASHGLLEIERQLRSHLSPTDEIRVIFETDDNLMLRLPWHCWSFFQDYPKAEMALSQPAYKRLETNRKPLSRKQIRILAILGDRRGIDVSAEQQALQALPGADVQFLIAPSREAFDRSLWDSAGWDILFFAGHSQTEDKTGRLYINEEPVHNSLTIAQLKEGLKSAIANGLQLAIFNSCDGIGLAQALGQLNIPQIVVMREPVPNRVAQLFLQHFLNGLATEQLSLYLAMRQARSRLQGLENEFPGASWLPVLCQNPSTPSLTWTQLGGVSDCPYRGLEAFGTADAHLFFGREKAIADLSTAVQHKPFVAVTGPSGSGKSSVVFAGLLPQLKQQSEPSWQIVSCRPGAKPFDALAESLMAVWMPSDKQQNSADVRLETLALSVEFQQDVQALWSAIAQHTKPNTRLLLIVDQFEELYTLCEEEDKQSFIDLLLAAAQSAPAFTLLLTLRADFYGHALSNRSLSDALQAGGYNLGPMSPAELKAAIAQPAAQCQVELEPGLTDKLIQATQGQAGRLPLLEFTLTELWLQQHSGQLTHQAYRAIGGIEEAVANHAEKVYAQLSVDEQQSVQRIFMQLIEPNPNNEATRRMASRDELGADNWPLVAKLASARLVITNRDAITGQETAEIIHEALIYNWGRLTYWLQIDGDFRRWQEDVRRAKDQWQKSEREPEALLRGKRLSIAAGWYDSRPDELSADDAQFIQQSLLVQEKAQKQDKRRRRTLIASLSAGLLAALGLSGLIWRQSQQMAISEVRAIVTSSNLLFASGQKLEALIDSLTADHLLNNVVLKDPETVQMVDSTLQQMISWADEKNQLTGHKAGVTAVAFSSDGQLLASASQDNSIKLWQPDGTLIATLLGHSEEVWGLAISPDGRTVASASNDKTVRLWQRDGTLIETLEGHEQAVKAVAFSRDGVQIASADRAGMVKVWQRDRGNVQTFKAHEENINAIAFSPGDSLLATGSDDSTIRTWRLSSTFDNKLEDTFSGQGDVVDIAFSPDGQTIASASTDRTIRLWKLDGSKPQRFMDGSEEAHNNVVYSIAFSPDGQSLVSASDDKTVKLWQRDGFLRATFEGHNNGVVSAAFSPDGQTIASASFDRTIRLWKENNNNVLLTALKGHSAFVRSVAFSKQDETIASASGDGTVKFWRLDGSLIETLDGDLGEAFSLALAPDEKAIAVGNRDGTLVLWDRTSGKSKSISAHEGWIDSVAFSYPDGQLIATASEDDTIKLWQPDGSALKTLRGHQNNVNQVAFSPNGQILASASLDKTIKLWQRDGTPIRTIEGHSASVNSVVFSPDGQFLASASDDRTVRIWDRDGNPVSTLEGHVGAAIGVTFSPDGETLASTSVDRTVRIWDRQGNLLETLSGYEAGTIGIAFSASGEHLAVTTADNLVTIWHLSSVLDEKVTLKAGCEWASEYLETQGKNNSNQLKICS